MSKGSDENFDIGFARCPSLCNMRGGKFHREGLSLLFTRRKRPGVSMKGGEITYSIREGTRRGSHLTG